MTIRQAEWVRRCRGQTECLLDRDFLADVAGFGIHDQDPVVFCHNCNPALAKGHCLGLNALWQCNLLWQAWAICRQADDKQADNHYKPANHHHS